MAKKHFVIYVPGLGDVQTGGQELAVRTWRLYGTHGLCLPMRWADGEPFALKLARLLQKIDEFLAQGHTVSLVGASAGASAVLNAYAARSEKVNGVVLICGKVNHPENMHPSTFQHNPAFKDSMAMLPASLARLNYEERMKILSIHPLTDPVVPVADTIVEGAIEKQVLSTGHGLTIARELTIGAYPMVRFLKRNVKN